MARITFRNLTTLMMTLGVFMGICAHSQEVIFRHYSSDQGFTGAAFKAMAQDSLGFLWITSGSGLFKFDGYTFTNYQSATLGNMPPLHAQGMDEIIKVDASGKVWITFNNYVAWFNKDKNLFIPIKVASGKAKVESLWFENENILWMGVAGKGLTRLDISTKNLVSFLNETQRDDKFNDNNTIKFIVPKGNSFLLGTKNGIWLFDKANKLFSKPPCSNEKCSSIFNGDVKKIFPHADHAWVWVDQQLIKVNADYATVQRLELSKIQQQFDFEKRFVDARITGMAEDHEGRFWMASQGLGLIFYDAQRNLLKNYRNDKNDVNSLPSDVLGEVMIDRDHNVWATTVNKGIVQLKKQSLVFYNYLNGMSSTGIGLIHSKNDLQLIVGTNGRNLWKSAAVSKNISQLKFEPFGMKPVRGFENVIELAVGKKNVWVGTMQAGVAGFAIGADGKINLIPHLYQHDERNENTISDNFITALWEDNEGHIWIGTLNGGVSIVDPRNYGKPGSVINYRHDVTEVNSLSGASITSFLLEDDGSLLITTSAGVDKVKSIKSGHTNLNFEHLLSGVYCKRIHKSLDGTLYVTTKVGLYKGVKTGETIRFTKLPHLGDRNLTYIQEDRLGRLWIMSFDGLFFFDPKEDFVLGFRKEDGLASSRSVMAGSATQTPDGMMALAIAKD